MSRETAGASRPQSLADLTTREFIDGYLTAHADKAEDEGWHTRAIVLREAIRRLASAEARIAKSEERG